MLNRNSSGFTLIELIIVMAITSALSLVAIIGQAQLRGQASFDDAIDKVVSSVAQAEEQATSAVNVVGGGVGSNSCAPGGPAGQYVFAGVAWRADNSLIASTGSPLELQYYEALPQGTACVFQTQSVNLPSGIQVTGGALPGGSELFVRTSNGGLASCPVSLTTNAAADFAAGTCANGTMTLTWTDADGRTSQMMIDQNGLAKRLN